MPHPLDAFKAARRELVAAQTAEQRAAADAAVFAFWAKLRDHVGEELMEHVTITADRQPGDFRISVPDHLIVVGRVADGDVLQFKVLRRHETQMFDHFADALQFGEPYPLRSSKPAELPGDVIDTAADQSEASSG